MGCLDHSLHAVAEVVAVPCPFQAGGKMTRHAKVHSWLHLKASMAQNGQRYDQVVVSLYKSSNAPLEEACKDDSG
jgi:hypothetical protein